MAQKNSTLLESAKSLLTLPSCLCLDAPLVAVSWAWLLSSRSQAGADWLLLLGLFAMVWLIYLFDRLYDTSAERKGMRTSLRHRFAYRNRTFLRILFGILLAIVAGLAAFFFFKLSGFFLVSIPLFLMVILYFGVFRFSRKTFQCSFPIKELMIGFCFALGVVLASGNWPQELPATSIGMALLFSLNCLVISKAEATEDNRVDPVAQFAQPRLLNAALPYLCALGVVVCSWATRTTQAESLCLAIGVACMLLLHLLEKKWIPSAWIQILADGCLLFPLALALFDLIY